MKSLLLVDCHNILYRSFFAIPDSLAVHDTIPTNALFGFIQTIFKIEQQIKPSHLIFCLDSKEKPIRSTILETYKANRPTMPDRMILQMKELNEKILPALHIPYFAQPGFEADDIIATFVRLYKNEMDKIFLLSNDRDLWQLLQDNSIRIINQSQGKKGWEEFTRLDLFEKVGITPDQVVDYKSITGDPSDNIKGIPGVGPKTAQKWLSQYGSLEHLFALEPNPVPKVLEYKELLQQNKVLIKLDEHVPIERKEPSAFYFREWNWETIEPILHYYRFQSLIRRFHPDGSAKMQKGTETKNTDLFPTLTADQLNRTFQTPSLICWIEDPLLYVCSDHDIQEYSLEGFSADSLFSYPAWYISLKERLLSKNENVYFFNGKLIAHKLFFSQTELRNILFNDVMLMWYLLEPNRKDYRFDDWIYQMTSSDQLIADTIWMAVEKTQSLLKQSQLENVYKTLELPLIGCLYQMEEKGIYISRQKLQKAKQMYAETQKNLENKIFHEAGEHFNIQSPKQLGFVLFKKLQLPAIKKTKTGFSTDAEVLEKIKTIHPIVSKILQHREVSKLLNTYLEPMDKWLDKNQLIHTCFVQAGPSTGRIASMNPNLQALPNTSEEGSVIRSLFQVRDPSHVFISADYSQIDLRVLAHLSNDTAMLDIFKQNGDIHDSTARKLFHVPSHESPAPFMRKLAKVVQFGIIYGMSSYGLSQTLSITDAEAKHYIHTYFTVYQGVKAFIDSTIAEAKKDLFVQTVSGRKRPIPELSSSRKMIQQLGERLAVNSKVQGSAADILKSAMVQLHSLLGDTQSFMVLTIHDEIIVEAPFVEKDKIIALMKEKMENAWVLSVPLIVNITTGDNLGDLH